MRCDHGKFNLTAQSNNAWINVAKN